MSETRSDKRKAIESQPLAMLREADRLSRRERVTTALRQVYGDATVLEGDALTDALEDEGLLS